MPPEPPHDRRRRSRDNDPRILLAWGALTLALVVPPQLLGGVEGWAVGVTGALALAALVAAHAATRDRVGVPYGSPLLIAMLALLGWTAVQALPLPCGLVELIGPTPAGHVLANRELLGDASAGACTLSWDPGATRWELVKGVALVASFAAAWLVAAAGHRRKVLIAVGASALLMALVGLAHRATGLDQVFGIYAPRYSMERPILAPLLNPNQLAGFLAMGVPVLAAVGVASHGAAVRTLWLAAAAICGATAVLTLSRGGLAGLIAGLVLLGVLLAMKDRGRSSVARFGWIGGLLAVTLALATYLALDPIRRELAEGDLSKVELIRDAGRFTVEHPWAGVGRGGFAAAFVQSASLAEYRAEHPENLFVQWAAEWGLPAALALIAVLGATLGRALRRTRSAERMGALAAVFSIAVHDLVDFSLELVGVAVVAAAALGAAVAPGRSRRPAHRMQHWSGQRSALPLAAGGALLLALMAPTLIGGSVRSLQDDLTDAMHRADRESFREHLDRALALHPSEPVFPLLAATEAVRNGSEAAPRWLNRTMQLAPGWPSPHVLAAQWLWARGATEQAMLEVRQAAERVPAAPRGILCGELRRHPQPVPLLRLAAPEGPMRAPFLEVAAGCFAPRSSEADAIDEMLLEADPAALQPHLRRARRLARAGRGEEAAGALRELAEQRPHESQVWLALAEAELAAGSAQAARRAVEQADELPGNRRELLEVEAKTRAALGDFEGMRSALQQLRGLAMGSSDQVAKAFTLEGDLWRQADRPAQAVAAYERAHRIDPRRDRLERVARAAEAMGDRVGAFRTYVELCQRHPDVERFCKAKERLRRAVRPDPSALGPKGEKAE